jgi:hypothetical protein
MALEKDQTPPASSGISSQEKRTGMIAPPQTNQLNVQTLAQQPTPQSDLERQRQMRLAWKAYKGDFHRPLKVGRDGLDPNVIVNRCAPIVDKGVSFLFGQVVKIEATDEASKSSSDIQDFIDGLWGDDDDKMTLLVKLAMNGGVCGQHFLKIIPAQGQMKYPRMVIQDPQLIRMVTPPDDCDLVLAFIIEYPGPNDTQCKQIIARVDPDGLAEIAGAYDFDDTWTITNYVRKNQPYGGMSDQWQQVGDPQEWLYPFPPLFTNQNLPNPNESWGLPDLPFNLIDQNNALNFNQSNTNLIIKHHAHPKTWARGIGTTQIEIGVDDLTVLQSDTAELQNLEMNSDLSSSRNFSSDIRSDMDEQSRVPAVALGRLTDLPRGNISGVALQLLFQPLIEKTVLKQRLYGRVIREITRAALVLAGLISVDQYEDFKIGVKWQSSLPNDDLQAAQTATVLSQLGVSKQTLLSSLGYDAEEEAEKNEAEDAKTVTAFSQGRGLPPALPQPGQPGQKMDPMMQQQQGGQQ